MYLTIMGLAVVASTGPVGITQVLEVTRFSGDGRVSPVPITDRTIAAKNQSK